VLRKACGVVNGAAERIWQNDCVKTLNGNWNALGKNEVSRGIVVTWEIRSLMYSSSTIWMGPIVSNDKCIEQVNLHSELGILLLLLLLSLYYYYCLQVLLNCMAIYVNLRVVGIFIGARVPFLCSRWSGYQSDSRPQGVSHIADTSLLVIYHCIGCLYLRTVSTGARCLYRHSSRPQSNVDLEQAPTYDMWYAGGGKTRWKNTYRLTTRTMRNIGSIFWAHGVDSAKRIRTPSVLLTGSPRPLGQS